MAKENEEFSFNDLNKLMNKTSKWGGLMSDGAGVSAITDYISTGNLTLNASLTGSMFKGVPANRSLEIFGPSGTAKTFLAMNIAAQAIKQGYSVIWYDSENAIESEQVSDWGIDLSKFRYEPTQTVQEFRTSITNVLDSMIEMKEKGTKIPKLLFVCDSVGNLATEKEIEDAKSGSDKVDFTKQKMMKSIFRILMSKMGIIGATFIFTNHCYSCVTDDTMVLMADGTEKSIKNINVGDLVKTLSGEKEVTDKVQYDNCSVYELEMEDGTTIKCTPNHKFLVQPEWSEDENDKCWKSAEEIVEGDIILSYK